MKFSQPLLAGTLIKRYRRSLADVRLADGSIVTAHVFNVGPMHGCCTPGSKVLLSDSNDVTRRHPMSWEMVEVGGTWVGVNPGVSRKVLREAIIAGSIPQMRGYTIQEEARYGRRRKVDFVLQSMEENCFIHVHPVCWVENGRGWFPESTTESSRQSMQELADIAKRGHRAIAFFHILRGDCRELRLSPQIDGHCARAVARAREEGVEFMTYRAGVTPEEIVLGDPLRFKPDA